MNGKRAPSPPVCQARKSDTDQDDDHPHSSQTASKWYFFNYMDVNEIIIRKTGGSVILKVTL